MKRSSRPRPSVFLCPCINAFGNFLHIEERGRPISYSGFVSLLQFIRVSVVAGSGYCRVFMIVVDTQDHASFAGRAGGTSPINCCPVAP